MGASACSRKLTHAGSVGQPVRRKLSVIRALTAEVPLRLIEYRQAASGPVFPRLT